jgi:DNA-binding MarR family transcriptional regulator
MADTGRALSPDVLKSLQCPCAAVRRASRAVTQLYDTVLAPIGLKCTQFTVLRILSEQGPTPQWRIAQENGIAVETLSRRLAALRSKGLIGLEVSGSRGEHVYSLTPQGARMYAAAMPYWQRAHERLLLVSGEGDLQVFISALDRVAEAAHNAMNLKTKNCMGLQK